MLIEYTHILNNNKNLQSIVNEHFKFFKPIDMQPHPSHEELNAEILALLSESISKRKKEGVILHNILEYEKHRSPIEDFKQQDFVTDKSRGSIGLMLGDILLPEDIEKIREETQSFFEGCKQKA